MFSKMKRLLGNVTVKVKNAIVYVDGIPADVMARDIKKIWGTGRIEKNIFIDIDDNSFSFYEFFAVEIVYAIDTLLEHPQARTSRRTLNKIKEALIEGTWLVGKQQIYPHILDRSSLSKFIYNPLDFQSRFFDAYEQTKQQNKLRGMQLAGAAGSGKTYTSLALVEMLGADLVVVVCPNNAIDRVWKDTLHNVFKEPPVAWFSNSNQPVPSDVKYMVVTYEYLAKLKALLKERKYKKLAILLDESHNFNEITSLRTELFLQICDEYAPDDVVWLSGTPIKALAKEAIPLIRCIDPMFTPECEDRFKKIFGVSSERASDIVKNRLDGLMFKIEKSELKLLPPIFKEVRVVVPNSAEFTLEAIRARMDAFIADRQAYYAERSKDDQAFFYAVLDDFSASLRSKAEKESYAYYRTCLQKVIKYQGDARFVKEEMIYCNRFEAREISPKLEPAKRKQFREVKSIVKYVKLKIQGECLGRVVGRARIEAHIAMAPCIDYVSLIETSTKKTLVYTSFTEVINVLEKKLPELGLEPLFVYGKTNSNLNGIIDKFEKDQDANPLVATYASLSTAVPLVMADTMLMIDVPWRDYQLQQTVSRINRLGADTQCYVYTAILDTGDKPNISTRTVDILKWSQSQVSALTGVQSPFEIPDDLEKADLALEEFCEPEKQISLEELPSFMRW